MKPIASVTLLKAALLAGIPVVALPAGMLQAHAEVGVAAAVNVDAKGRPPGAQPRVITLGSNVVFNEEITTDAVGLVQILLLDGTTFTVGPNSQLTIDEFVYDPNTGDAKVVASLTKGVFRFVGARTSQTDGGATVKTPVGTIGIRGAVTNISYDPSTGESTASLVAGNKLNIVDGDGTQRIVYETGYTAVISKDPAGGTTTTVRKSTKEETGLIQKQLSGKPGQNGGNTGAPPSDEQTQEVSETNSGLPTIMDVPGSTKPVQSSEPDQVEEVAGIDGKTQDDLDNDIEEEQEQEQPNARVFTAPTGGYVVDPVNGGGTVPDAGPRGLVGSTPDSDQGVILTVDGGRLRTSTGSLDLPDYSGVTEQEGDPAAPEELYPELDEFVIPVGEAIYLGEELGGWAFAGRGDFVAYLLGIDGDMTRPVQVIYGTPSTPAQLDQLRDDNVKVREYALTLDPIQQAPVPFFSDDAYGLVNEYYGPQLALHSTNLLVIESDGSSDPRYYQSWVHISGEGVDQKSAAFLSAGSMFEDEAGNLQIGSSRRGTYRSHALFGPVNMRGGLGTRPGATGEHLFGPNVDNFVIGTSVDPADSFNDAPLDFGEVFPGPDDGGPFATTHVASLIDERNVSDYGTPAHPVGRTSREVSGFIAGMGEGFVGDPLYQKEAPYVLGSDDAPNLLLRLDADTSQVRARAEVFDILDQNDVVESMLIRFGPHDGENGGNAFIDDHIFGAQKNNGAQNTRLRTDGTGDGPDGLAHGGSFTPGSYLVSGRANPIDGYKHLEGCEQCDFIDWGWWGTRIETDKNAAAGVPHERRDFVHMGTWVAGDVSTDAEIDAIAGLPAFEGEVSYEGTVMANVVRDTDPGVAVSNASYIATGDLSIDYDFGNRTGTVNIDQFDIGSVGPAGISLDGELGESGSMQSQLFSGTLSGSNLYTMGAPDNGDDPLNNDMLYGNLSGAFVNSSATPPDGGPNVAAGLVGNFDFVGPNVEPGVGADVKASGTIAGVRELPTQ